MEILFKGKVKNKADYYFYEQAQKDSFKDGFAYGSLITVKDKSFICIGGRRVTIQEIIESIDYCLKCNNDRIPTTQEDLQTIKEALEMKQSQNINTNTKFVVHCKDCVFTRKRYGKLECINGISYRNTYNDPNMFCSYGKREGEQE